MSTPSQITVMPIHTPSHFRHTCGFCGCVFRVEISRCITSHYYKNNQDTRPYNCPECQRNSLIKTASEPQVIMISERTDGRTSPCPPSK